MFSQPMVRKRAKSIIKSSMLDLLNKRFMGNALNRNYQWLDFTQGAGNLLQGLVLLRKVLKISMIFIKRFQSLN